MSTKIIHLLTHRADDVGSWRFKHTACKGASEHLQSTGFSGNQQHPRRHMSGIFERTCCSCQWGIPPALRIGGQEVLQKAKEETY